MASVTKYFAMALAVFAYGVLAADALDTSENCKDELFCNEKPDYYDAIQQEIDSMFEPIQKKLNLNTDDYEEEAEETVESEFNCRYRTRVMKPYTLRSNDTTKVIVQSSFYEQKFKVTECAPQEENMITGEECFTEFTGLSKGYCKTKYSSIALYIFDTIHRKIERVPVLIPVCCACSIYS